MIHASADKSESRHTRREHGQLRKELATCIEDFTYIYTRFHCHMNATIAISRDVLTLFRGLRVGAVWEVRSTTPDAVSFENERCYVKDSSSGFPLLFLKTSTK